MYSSLLLLLIGFSVVITAKDGLEFSSRVKLNNVQIPAVQVDNGPTTNFQQMSYYGVKYGTTQRIGSSYMRWEPARINMDYSYFKDPSQPAKGYWCHWFFPGLPVFFPFHEDCLYLDIYAPPIHRDIPLNQAKRPVMVWIHGGAFLFGTKDEYPSADLARNINAIIIPIQYRLGPFGFLSTGDGVLPGNLGLQDVKIAFNWIRQNIANFGGDPDKITLVGQSAGSVLISAMLMDPEINSLVFSAILMSGSLLAPFSARNTGLETFTQMAELLGCNGNSSSASLECMKGKTADEIMLAAISPIFQYPTVIAGQPFALIPDGIHIPLNPTWFLQSRKRKLKGGILIGYLSEDSSVFMDYPNYYSSMMGANQPNTTWIRDSAIKTTLASFWRCKDTDNTKEMVDEIFSFYGFQNASFADRRQKIIEMVTWGFSAYAIKEAKLYAQSDLAQLGTQLYIISVVHDFKPLLLLQYPDVTTQVLGAYHFTDVAFLFGPSLPAVQTNLLTPPSSTPFADITRQMQLLWGQMVHHGTASDRTFNLTDGNHLSLGSSKKWQVKSDPNLAKILQLVERVEAWDCGRSKPPAPVVEGNICTGSAFVKVPSSAIIVVFLAAILANIW